jgi:hypothetical protein
MRPSLIGISGKIASGKTSVAKNLTKYGYKRVAFADKLKEMVSTLDGSNPTDKYLMVPIPLINIGSPVI